MLAVLRSALPAVRKQVQYSSFAQLHQEKVYPIGNRPEGSVTLWRGDVYYLKSTLTARPHILPTDAAEPTHHCHQDCQVADEVADVGSWIKLHQLSRVFDVIPNMSFSRRLSRVQAEASFMLFSDRKVRNFRMVQRRAYVPLFPSGLAIWRCSSP